MGVKFQGLEVGEPTEVYAAGKYEICFVPRSSIMEFQGKRVKSIGFMIAARSVGQRTWKYLDGAPLRTRPELLRVLFPDLEAGVKLPPNAKELL